MLLFRHPRQLGQTLMEQCVHDNASRSAGAAPRGMSGDIKDTLGSFLPHLLPSSLPSCERKHESFVQTLTSRFTGHRERSRATLGPMGLPSVGSLPGST